MYWRHVVASCVADCKESDAKDLIAKAEIDIERPGSDRYQQSHMGLIFREGLSFSGFERNKVFLGRPGSGSSSAPRFEDVSDISGADSEGDCRAAVVADFDDDGDPDIFVNAIQRECHMLFRNDAGNQGGNGFVKVKLRAKKGHPDAIGAIVTLDRGGAKVAQVLSCGTGFESQNALELVFGLGESKEGRLSVLWPGRGREEFGTVGAGERCSLVEGAGKPEAYAAKTFAFRDPRPRGIRVRLGDALAPLKVRGIDGSEQAVGTVGDKPLLLNFWATTCRSCVAELPLLEKVHQSGRYRVIAVSLDPPSRVDRIGQLWQKLSLSLDHFRIESEEASVLFDLARLAIPVSLVVSPEGKVRRILSGKIEDGDL